MFKKSHPGEAPFESRGLETCFGDHALVENAERVRAGPQSCVVEGCAGIVRWRDRQNHAFAP